MPAPSKTTPVEGLEGWIRAGQTAGCSRVELLNPSASVVGAWPIESATGARLVDAAKDDAQTTFGRVTYVARVYDGETFREGRKVVIQGGASSPDEAETAPATTDRTALAQVSRLLETTVREVVKVAKSCTDALAIAGENERETRAEFRNLIREQLEWARAKTEQAAIEADLTRRIERDRAIAKELGPLGRALLQYFTGGKAVATDESMGELLDSIMGDEERALQIVGLLTPRERNLLNAAAQANEAAREAKKRGGGAAPAAAPLGPGPEVPPSSPASSPAPAPGADPTAAEVAPAGAPTSPEDEEGEDDGAQE